ncbi:MAG TPA: amidohydrolase family protein [Phycisphaerae bacterium]|nr:amidohydrolase family protein [Phycisphaerae bacterium]
MNRFLHGILVLALTALVTVDAIAADVAVRAKKLYTMEGDPITNGVVVIRDGKIAAVGQAASVNIPKDAKVFDAEIVTPGLVDAHATVGLTGILNQKQDQDQLEHSDPIQPQLRAIDAYNAHDPLVEWVRQFGVTTVNTGHAPGELISGQTMIIKTRGNTVEDGLIRETATVAVTLAKSARKGGDKSPGTRGKMMSMLREAFVQTQAYMRKRDSKDPEKKADLDFKKEILASVLRKEVPLMVTADRANDIANALRLAKEFDFQLILDGAAESHLMIDEIKAAGVPVILHPTMARYYGDLQNASMETATTLRDAGILVAMQSGFEDYVPKTRVVLFEAAIAAANGLGFEGALRTITIDAAKILDIDDRVGSIAVGKDGDLALYDGDPFEYTSHCVGVLIDGQFEPGETYKQID